MDASKAKLVSLKPVFLTLPYQESLFASLEKLVSSEKQLDGLIIDLMQTGFSLPLESLSKFMVYGNKLLNHDGLLLLIKPDGALCLAKDDPAGGFSISLYDSPLGFTSRYPAFAEYARSAVPGIDARYIQNFNNTLARHVLGASIPILTFEGKTQRKNYTLDLAQNRIVQLIDDYTSVEAILHTLESRHSQSPDETLQRLRELEAAAMIFPLFARVDFLAKCYQNKKPFRLGRYMVESGIITEAQLQLLLEQQQEEQLDNPEHALLGILAVKAGYISTRMLQSMLVDQFLYGGSRRRPQSELSGVSENSAIESMRDSMIGSLGAMDTPGLLQSLGTANKTGLLTIEDRDKVLLLEVLDGRPIAAKMNKLRGHEALLEFVTTWTDGIFVFKDKGSSPELDQSCRITRNLSRILLDSALCQDHIQYIVNFMHQGQKTILERRSNFDQNWQLINNKPLQFIDETEVTPEDRLSISHLASLIDSFRSVEEIVKSFDIWPTHRVLKALYLLLEQDLVAVQTGNLFGPLSVFQKIVLDVEALIGRDANKVILQASLYFVHGDSASADRFQIDQYSRISVNMNHMQTAGEPVTAVLVELRQWMEAYLGYCRQKVAAETIDALVSAAVRKKT
jgi:hypothetical protein